VTFKAPFISDETLRREAEAFTEKYNPSRIIPVPIDVIAERDFDIDIVPLPGIQDNFDTVAFISRDLTTIYVDEYILQKRENRYRFSVAHELAHRVLHADVFRQLSFDSIASWKDVVTNTIPEDQYGFVESHANTFAGLVLLPQAELRQAFSQAIDRAKQAGVDIIGAGFVARDIIESYVGREFSAAQKTAHIRIERDGLWDEVEEQ